MTKVDIPANEIVMNGDVRRMTRTTVQYEYMERTFDFELAE